MDLYERMIYWLEVNEAQCEERDIINDAFEEIRKLLGDVVLIDSVVLCKLCHKPDTGCQCTHESRDQWMTLTETIEFLDQQIAKLRDALREIADYADNEDADDFDDVAVQAIAIAKIALHTQ